MGCRHNYNSEVDNYDSKVLVSACVQVRRAYKKSALQLHPDKALAQCRFSDRLGPHGVQLLDTSQVRVRKSPRIQTLVT